MVRRSFRFGWRLGLLAGVGFAIAKLVQSRRSGAPSFSPQAGPAPSFSPQAAPWPPMPEPAPAEPAEAAAPGPAEPAAAAPPTEAAAPAAAVPAAEVPDVTPPHGDEIVPHPDAPARPAAKAAAAKRSTKKAAAAAWVEPDGDVCPQTHPVKAKLSSKIFHMPGMFAYERCRPDRCYRDDASAEGDGLRKAKR